MQGIKTNDDAFEEVNQIMKNGDHASSKSITIQCK